MPHPFIQSMLVLDTPWLSRLNKDCALVTRAHFLPSLADTTVGSLALPAHWMARLSSVSDFLVVLPGMQSLLLIEVRVASPH